MASGTSAGITGASTDWLWEALMSRRHAHGVVTQLVPPDYNWNGIHPVHGTPLMATANRVVRSGQVKKEVRSTLPWVLREGADPQQTAMVAHEYSGGWGNGTDEFPQPGAPKTGPG